MTTLAYAAAMYLIFPKYWIQPPAPFHSDMYWSANFAAEGVTPLTFVSWPRPVFYETLLLGGQFGLVGSLVFLQTLLLGVLALMVFACECLVLREEAPLLLVFAALLVAMLGPGFYVQPAFDVGFHISLGFLLLGIVAWEMRWPMRGVAVTLLFAMSTLASEACVPALIIYALASAWFHRESRSDRAILMVAMTAIMILLVDERITQTPFVNPSAASTSPYWIDLGPASILKCALFYVKPLANPALLMLTAICSIGIWYKRSLAAGAFLVITGLSLYVPYVVLPNHLDVTYRWVALPSLALLILSAWPSGNGRQKVAIRAALIIAVIGAIVYQSGQYHDQKAWVANVESQNRAMMSDLHNDASEFRGAKRILVVGLTYPYHPFHDATAFLARELSFSGKWIVVTEPGYAPISAAPNAEPIGYNSVIFRDYDKILIFAPDGHIVGCYNPSQIAVMARAAGLSLGDPRAVIALIRGSAASSLSVAKRQFYPLGVKAGQEAGIYPSASQRGCCFMGVMAKVQLPYTTGARAVVLSFYVPSAPVFARVPERLTIAVEGENKRTERTVELSEGFHNVAVVAPAHARDGFYEVSVRAATTFVPIALNINKDKRTLSVILARAIVR